VRKLEPFEVQKPMNEEDLLHLARQRKTPAERAAFLDDVCAADATLRARLEERLRKHKQPAGLHEAPTLDPDFTADYSPHSEQSPTELAKRPKKEAAGGVESAALPVTLEGPGTRIGPYKLL
jgi:hypothetical protein